MPRNAKIVEWSEKDECYVGSCPDLLYGGCHGDDKQEVFAELCEIVEENVDPKTRESLVERLGREGADLLAPCGFRKRVVEGWSKYGVLWDRWDDVVSETIATAEENNVDLRV